MSDKTESQQDTVDSNIESCHSDKNKSSDKSTDNCCQDMNSCGNSVSFVSNLSMQVQVSHLSVQLPSNDHIVLNSSSPPERPPKLIV